MLLLWLTTTRERGRAAAEASTDLPGGGGKSLPSGGVRGGAADYGPATMPIAPALATDPLSGLTPPGAMTVARDGRFVTRHYGSVATELAVCRKSVGMALRTELRVLEVAGREPWLERLLDRALRGHHPVPGEAAVVAAAGTWCARVGERTALVVGPPGRRRALAPRGPRGRHRAAARSPPPSAAARRCR